MWSGEVFALIGEIGAGKSTLLVAWPFQAGWLAAFIGIPAGKGLELPRYQVMIETAADPVLGRAGP